MYYSFGKVHISNRPLKELSPIVCSQNLDRSFELIFHVSQESHNNSLHLHLIIKQICPGVSATVIKNCKEIFGTTQSRRSIGTLQVHMNQIKRFHSN